MFGLIEGEAMMMPQRSTKSTKKSLFLSNLVFLVPLVIFFVLLVIYFPNQPIGRPERSTQTLFTCVYSSSACRPISRP